MNVSFALEEFQRTRRFHPNGHRDLDGDNPIFGYMGDSLYINIERDGRFMVVLGGGGNIHQTLEEAEKELLQYARDEGGIESYLKRRLDARIEELKKKLVEQGVDVDKLLKALEQQAVSK